MNNIYPDKENNKKTIKVLMFGPALNVKGGISTVEKLLITNCPNNVIIKHISTTIDNNKFIKIIYFFYAILKTIINVYSYDILHIHFASKGSIFRKIIIGYIGMIFKKKIIMHAHGAKFHIFFENLPKLFQNILKLYFNKIEALLTLSNGWKDYYKKIFSIPTENIYVLSNPIKIQTKELKLSDESKIRIVFLGRIGKRKGTFDLLEATSLLQKNSALNIELIIAGDGEVENARELSTNLNISDYVKIYEWLNEEERNKVLSKSHIFILPSYNEGLPLALLEAMSFGLAVITTPVGGIPEVIRNGENGILVEPGDIFAIADAIKKLVRDVDYRFKLQIAALETAKNYDINKYMHELISIYKKVLYS